MLLALRVAWEALVALSDEMLTLLRGNVAWLALSAPLILVVAAVLLPFVGAPGEAGESPPELLWPLAIAASLLLVIPAPAMVGLGALARIAAGREAPHFGAFREAVAQRWRQALGLFFTGCAGVVLLAANVYFYAVVAEGWLKLVAILWVYAMVFWLSMHTYVVPLTLHVAQPRLLDVYRRAATLTLGHPLFTLVVAAWVVLVAVLSTAMPPVYLLFAAAYVALVQAHAFRTLRRLHGDLPADEDAHAP